MPPLTDHVAVVAGATRGAGRGIARMLGEAGATVYCTGRSSRTQPNDTDHRNARRPETIEETAELVDAAGGRGIPVRVDHRFEPEVKALFARVKREQGRLDVLVNVMTGAEVTDWSPFHRHSAEAGRAWIDGWLWPHLVTCRHALPLMRQGKSGLVVEIGEGHDLDYRGQMFFDLAHTMMKRLAYGIAYEYRDDGITALFITPGFMRTEEILERFGVTEANWRDAAESNAEAKGYGFAGSETPCFVGRAVAALAADPERARWSGGVYGSWELSDVYGFSDVDGERPHWGRYGRANFPQYFDQPWPLPVRWEAVRAGVGV